MNAEKPADALNKYICALPGEIELIGLELELDCNEFYASMLLSFFKRSNVSSDERKYLFLFFGSADLPSGSTHRSGELHDQGEHSNVSYFTVFSPN